MPIASLPPAAPVRLVRGHVPKGASILIIKEPWISLILDGRKSLEIRGQQCCKPAGERIYLAQSGGGGIVLGSAKFQVCMGPLTGSEWQATSARHCVAGKKLPYGCSTHAWQFDMPERFETPVPYHHKPGVIVWAKMA